MSELLAISDEIPPPILLPLRKRAAIDAARACVPQREVASRVPLRFKPKRTSFVTEVFF